MWSQKKYRGSAQEREHLGRLYIEYDGDMDRIMESALCAETEDEPRVREILQSLIDAQEIPAFRTFTHESAQKRRNRRRKVRIFSCIHTYSGRGSFTTHVCFNNFVLKEQKCFQRCNSENKLFWFRWRWKERRLKQGRERWESPVRTVWTLW